MNLELEENDEKLIDNFQSLISKGNMNQNIKDKMMMYLLNKVKENLDKENKMKNKLKEINDHTFDVNLQIKNINEDIESQNLFLKKIKSLYIFLVNLLMRKNNYIGEKIVDNKINIGNNELNKNKNSQRTLFDFIHRYADYIGHKNIIGFTNSIKNNKLKLSNKLKNKYFSNIVQRGENFSIKNENFDFDDYLNKFEILSFKSRKSNKFNDSFSFSAEDKNMNSSFSVMGSNNIFNMNFDNSNYNLNQNLLSDDNIFWKS